MRSKSITRAHYSDVRIIILPCISRKILGCHRPHNLIGLVIILLTNVWEQKQDRDLYNNIEAVLIRPCPNKGDS